MNPLTMPLNKKSINMNKKLITTLTTKLLGQDQALKSVPFKMIKLSILIKTSNTRISGRCSNLNQILTEEELIKGTLVNLSSANWYARCHKTQTLSNLYYRHIIMRIRKLLLGLLQQPRNPLLTIALVQIVKPKQL